MNGIELQDREFFAAIREGREPNASVAQVLPCYRDARPARARSSRACRPDAWPLPTGTTESTMIIDCHGHYTTAPPALEAWRKRQIAAIGDPARSPSRAALAITDDEIRASLEGAQLRMQRERGTDLTIFSPRASFMAHHIGDEATSREWSRVCNDLDRAASARSIRTTSSASASCRSRPASPPENCIPELERCVNELGFIGCNLNPDPSGGHWKEPPLTDRCWYPLYEKMVELDVPAMVHVSASCNPCFHATGAHYINADTTAFMQFLTVRPVQGFPDAQVHHPARRRRGAVPLGALPGLAQDMKRPPLAELLLNNVFFDTCVYHRPGIELLLKVDSRRQHPVRVGDGRRGARHRSGDRAPLRRHAALRRPDRVRCRAADRAQDLRGQRASRLRAAGHAVRRAK